jgi:hypothetical protein
MSDLVVYSFLGHGWLYYKTRLGFYLYKEALWVGYYCYYDCIILLWMDKRVRVTRYQLWLTIRATCFVLLVRLIEFFIVLNDLIGNIMTPFMFWYFKLTHRTLDTSDTQAPWFWCLLSDVSIITLSACGPLSLSMLFAYFAKQGIQNWSWHLLKHILNFSSKQIEHRL